MKVRVNITVDVDPERWEDTYGISDGFRGDVREYVVQMVHAQLAAVDVLTEQADVGVLPR